MAFHRAMSAFLLLALVSVSTTVGAEGTTREARIEATIPQPGFFMGAGFDSVWMTNLATNKLIRIHARASSSPSALSGSPGQETTNSIALI